MINLYAVTGDWNDGDGKPSSVVYPIIHGINPKALYLFNGGKHGP